MDTIYEEWKQSENIKSIYKSIITKLNSDKQFSTEEATKNGLILPLFNILGYDVFDTDEFKPEVSADVGAKQGEKVDYAVYIKGQPVMIIECKQRDKKLDNHINQLYRYFATVPDMHLAILTNGDDYWFFTDSERSNIMDLEPYMKLKLSTADDVELKQLDKYSKSNITKLDIKKDMKWQSFNDECDKLVEGLYSGNVPNYIIKAIASEAGTSVRELNQYNMAEIVYSKLLDKFKQVSINESPQKEIKQPKEEIKIIEENEQNIKTRGELQKETMQKNKENKSNIKLNHEYIYNDYSDGNWVYHTIEYYRIFEEKIESSSAKQMLIDTVQTLFDLDLIIRDEILQQEQFNKTYAINAEPGNKRGMHHLEKYDVFISTSYGISDIIRFIDKLFEYAGINSNNLRISFKD